MRPFNIFYLVFILLIIKTNCALNKKEKLSSCDEKIDSKNKFILKTDLSQNELEQLFSKNFSLPEQNNKKKVHKKNINENVKEFKSKDNSNKTIFLLEINNFTEQIDKNNVNNETNYELIDSEDNNETKIFLSFDKFFKTQYKEMFEYSYTIIIFILILIIFVIYYAFILPNEASNWNINSPVPSNNPRRNINIENDYLIKDDEI